MKRLFAAVLLLAALGVFLKLTLKAPAVSSPPVSREVTAGIEAETVAREAALLDKYPQAGDLVRRVFGHDLEQDLVVWVSRGHLA